MKMSILAPDQFGAASAPYAEASFEAPAKRACPPRKRIGLAGRLLILTIASVAVTMNVFYVTRLSLSRENWVRDRLFAAETATMVFGADEPAPLPKELTKKILDAVGAKMIMLSTPNHQLVLKDSDLPVSSDYSFDNTDPSMIEGIEAAYHTMFAARGSTLRAAGPGPTPGSRVEIVVDQTSLIDQMWRLSRTFLTLSLIVSTALTLVLWGALWQLVIRPVRRFTDNIVAFGENPQDFARVVTPSGRDDEIGRAEAALATMQTALAHELSQRKRLAELGMAVARVNHDLRNMLATAQLISDRLATIKDPLAQRLAPQLVATLDRAIEFCQSTLTYGAARERAPIRRAFDLNQLVTEIVETAEAAGACQIAFALDIPPNFEIYADRDHVRRILENLARNAFQALASQTSGRPAAIRFAAIRNADNEALIEVSDSGPGLPREAGAHIFEPFHHSTREGGSGLGLAIAGDLVQRNGGLIRLAPTELEDFYCGARFLITLPAPQSARKASRLVIGA
jgi:signal transduction histidine kinase